MLVAGGSIMSVRLAIVEKNSCLSIGVLLFGWVLALTPGVKGQNGPPKKLSIVPPSIAADKSVNYDYDIVYVRAPRYGDQKKTRWPEVFDPRQMDPGADLMLLRPDGSEEVVVKGGAGSVQDPMVSFDAEWVYYSYFHPPMGTGGSDIYKVHVKTRKVVRLTHQEWTPNTGVTKAIEYSAGRRPSEDVKPAGVYNLGPCPAPGGKVVFTSDRNAFKPPRSYPPITQQLFAMDEDGSNVEQTGYLNIGCALHPVMMTDGRIMFSSMEAQGLRHGLLWGIWHINPDGANWGPLLSAYDLNVGTSFHFQTQLSDGSLVVVAYYNLNNSGFGTLLKFPDKVPDDLPRFGPARPISGTVYGGRMPFSPYGMETLTPFTTAADGWAPPADPADKNSPYVGRFTHPAGAPDNHLLTVWSSGKVNYRDPPFYPVLDSGIYLIKSGKAIGEPGEMLLIKNDPQYNEQWPRPLVPYDRIYGVKAPTRLPWLPNDGKVSPHLPAGTPYGLVGVSSLYKRETYPGGVIPKGSVTAGDAGKDPAGYAGLGGVEYQPSNPYYTSNWSIQGADAGKYQNSDIHAIRIVMQEPLTRGEHRFRNHANERLRILGEIPVRHFIPSGTSPGTAVPGLTQPLDPDGNPDTSFLAKIPADVAWTFQTLDKDGMVLNMAQTWHQVRPGEVRNNCGGCHAHSQKPTPFEKTAAARKDYAAFDLTRRTPLLTAKVKDESGRQWDKDDVTGLRYEAGVKDVEYHRDIQPILQRSCVACHTKAWEKPAGKLVLDDDNLSKQQLPQSYHTLAGDFRMPGFIGMGQASRYVRRLESRRSLLVWKIHGRRTDGWTNDDFPTYDRSTEPPVLMLKGKLFKGGHPSPDWDYTGSAMPPPEAVAGSYVGPDGKKIKVAPLGDEDRRTIVRWIDLGCPIDLTYDPAQPAARGAGGWLTDETRPTLALAQPRPGDNDALTSILVGMHDAYSGLDESSFEVIADFAVNGMKPGQNLAAKFQPRPAGVWELKLATPLNNLPLGKLTVSVRDRQGNITRLERTFAVVPRSQGNR
jgi:hypothetical protein